MVIVAHDDAVDLPSELADTNRRRQSVMTLIGIFLEMHETRKVLPVPMGYNKAYT